MHNTVNMLNATERDTFKWLISYVNFNPSQTKNQNTHRVQCIPGIERAKVYS